MIMKQDVFRLFERMTNASERQAEALERIADYLSTIAEQLKRNEN